MTDKLTVKEIEALKRDALDQSRVGSARVVTLCDTALAALDGVEEMATALKTLAKKESTWAHQEELHQQLRLKDAGDYRLKINHVKAERDALAALKKLEVQTMNNLDQESECILAMTDEELLADAVKEYGNEKGATAAAENVRLTMLLAVREHQRDALATAAAEAELKISKLEAFKVADDLLAVMERDALAAEVEELRRAVDALLTRWNDEGRNE